MLKLMVMHIKKHGNFKLREADGVIKVQDAKDFDCCILGASGASEAGALYEEFGQIDCVDKSPDIKLRRLQKFTAVKVTKDGIEKDKQKYNIIEVDLNTSSGLAEAHSKLKSKY